MEENPIGGTFVKIIMEVLDKIIDAVRVIINAAKKKRKIKNERLKKLSNKNFDMSYQYNKIIIENFVPRKFQCYNKNNKKDLSINRIKSEIQNKRYPIKNIIITGQAGIGKSTALKWLFMNCNVRNCDFIYLYPKMFSRYDKLDNVLNAIANIIPNGDRAIVFWDGLDEMTCIKGKTNELQKIINFIDEFSNPNEKNSGCKFVISTRPEHFEFNYMIINKNTEKSLSNYSIFEMKQLTAEESFKMCKSTKKLWESDGKDIFKKSSSEKNDGYALTEKEYIKLLKKYLHIVSNEVSLLKNPLFCRYAYQIICDWHSKNQQQPDQVCVTQCEQVQNTLEAYVKWEFHDTYSYQTEGQDSVGKKYLVNYKKQVFEFLTDVAGKMGIEDIIAKKDWSEIKNIKNIKNVNKVYCGLQENEDGNLCFIHKLFKDFFLARYYVLRQKEYIENKEKNKEFIHLLKPNSEFAIMYAELLMKEGGDLAKKVCSDILKDKKREIKHLAEYAKGTIRFMYNPEMSFTITDYFTVFPNGVFIYWGVELNKDKSMLTT